MDRLWCDGCTAEEVVPPLRGSAKAKGKEESYDCSFRSGLGPRPGPGPPLPPAPPCRAALQNGTQCHGAQIGKGGVVAGGQPDECCAACGHAQGCGAFTFAPGLQVDVPDCWLHEANECALTGKQSSPNPHNSHRILRILTNPCHSGGWARCGVVATVNNPLTPTVI